MTRTKKLDIPVFVENYPAIKKALWEAWRVFIPAFLAVVYAQFEAGVDLKNTESWILPLISAALLAGIKATLKWARDTYGNQNYSSLIYKIPM